MDVDNSVEIVGGGEYIRGLNGNGKNTVKVKLKNVWQIKKYNVYLSTKHNNKIGICNCQKNPFCTPIEGRFLWVYVS